MHTLVYKYIFRIRCFVKDLVAYNCLDCLWEFMIRFFLCGVVLYTTHTTMAQCPPISRGFSVISNLLVTGTNGDFSFYEFRHTGIGSSTTTNIQITRDIKSAEILMIGGGGGGGGGMHRNRGPGGGGAGRLLTIKGIDIAAGTFVVTVGAGGRPGATGGSGRGGNGMNSVFLGYTAVGGGGGGAATEDRASSFRHGSTGGSGGGGGDYKGTAGGVSIVNSAQSFGNVGGISVGMNYNDGGAGGGGGGAGGIGQNMNGYTPGAGGSGMAINMNGTMQFYAQGGHGGMWDEYPDTVAHMGHGGNAGRKNGIGYVGSSGVVFLRYRNMCVDCQKDGFPEMSSISGCLQCPLTSNSNTSGGTCVCTTGFAPCMTCPAGYIISRGDNGTCVSCPANTYNPIQRGLVCISCPADTRASPGSLDLKNCKCRGEEVGTSGLTGPDGGPCEICPAQHYKTTAGSGSCDKIINISRAISLPYVIGTPVRNILDRGFRGNWAPGDQIRVHRGGRRGHNDVVLTYTSTATHGGLWIPPNVNPMLQLQDKYFFFVQSYTLLQINVTESGFTTMS